MNVITFENMVNNFYKNQKECDLNEIIEETRNLNKLKSMYVKHAFNELGPKFKHIYDIQEKFLLKLKLKFKENYGDPRDKA